MAPIIMFWPLVLGFPSGPGIAVYIALLPFLIDLNYTLHGHVHREFTRFPILNRILDISLGSVTGMTSANWRIQHVYGHHRGDDAEFTWKSLEWTLKEYSPRGALLYSFGNVIPTFIAPIVSSFRNGVLKNVKDPINYRAAFIEQMALIAFVLVLAWFHPLWTLGFLVPWYALVFAITRYVDYLNHYGCGSGTFDCANNCLNASFNRRKHNFGYHAAHHIDPAAHWTELPAIHATIEDQIPSSRLKPFSWSTALFPYHAFRSLRGGM